MITATITREKSKNTGTFGLLAVNRDGEAFECQTLELPWRENRRRVSCIPAGVYRAEWGHSGRFGACYHVRDVPGRGGILIHPGNHAGDVAKGLKSDVEGCILLGVGRGVIAGQPGITQSRAAVKRFATFMGGEAFRLEIR